MPMTSDSLIAESSMKKKEATAVIAVIFDFDDTLAPDSTSGFLESVGIDTHRFWKDVGGLVKQGWDPIPCYLQRTIDESQSRPSAKRITKAKLADWGRRAPLFAGVPKLFPRLRRQMPEGVTLEFYLISSGIRDVLRETAIADQFHDIWASDFAYNKEGEIVGIKNVVSFTDKTRFLFQIEKGLVGPNSRSDPFAVNRKVSEGDLRIPFEQMIVVGDGYTDIPCFSLVQKGGGIAIGVYDRESRERWGKAWGFLEERRVLQLVAADYRKHSGLDDALSLAIDNISKRLQLKSMIYRS